MFVTIDPYNSISRFNEIKEALKNNNVDYDLFISIKPPFNWYFELKTAPIMVNYDEITHAQTRFLVNTVKPATSSDAYLLIRRNDGTGKSGFLKYTENEPLKEARTSKYGIFFTVGGRDELLALSKEYPGKLWFLGKYYKNRFKLCLCTHPGIKLLLHPDRILLEQTNNTEAGAFEAEFNFKILRGTDYIKKFAETPYAQTGRYIQPKILTDKTGQFIL